MSEIVERLRSWTTDWDGAKMVPGEAPRDGLHCDVIDEAADRIETLEVEVARMRRIAVDATAHLAGAASAYESFAKRHPTQGKAKTDALFGTRNRDFKKAVERCRAALSPTTEQEGE